MSLRPFLAVDVGNSTVKAGLWSRGKWTRIETAPTSTGPESDWERMVRRLVGSGRVAAGVSSVVPEVALEVAAALESVLGAPPFLVHGEMEIPAALSPFRTLYETPTTLGADRLAGAAAAYWHHGRPAGRPVLVIDAGTAVTLDAVTPEGHHLGGAILPGPEALMQGLTRGTAQLPPVDWSRPERAIGRSSATSIQSGLARLLEHGLSGLVRDATNELPAGTLLIGTGGWAKRLSEYLAFDAVDDSLVLEGVRLLVDGPGR